MSRIPIQNHKRMAIQGAVLRTLYTSGIIAATLLAPKITRSLSPLNRGKARRQELYSRINLATARLKQRGYVHADDEGRLHLTERGTRSIERILLREYRIPEQTLWDGKWRMLLFDVRESRRRMRGNLRVLLESAEFVRLQDSAWVHPYPCDEFVALVRAHLSVGIGELRSMVIEALESDRSLRQHFGLS